eukprot:1157608-Amphidinium_carterae.1
MSLGFSFHFGFACTDGAALRSYEDVSNLARHLQSQRCSRYPPSTTQMWVPSLLSARLHEEKKKTKSFDLLWGLLKLCYLTNTTGMKLALGVTGNGRSLFSKLLLIVIAMRRIPNKFTPNPSNTSSKHSGNHHHYFHNMTSQDCCDTQRMEAEGYYEQMQVTPAERPCTARHSFMPPPGSKAPYRNKHRQPRAKKT